MMRGLYAITGNYLSEDKLLVDVEQALIGGAAIIQYRDKQASANTCEQTAMALHALCKEYGVMLVINDDVELAQRVNADGVHLGSHDTALTEARQYLGAGKVIGVSCYNDAEQALRVAHEGADYIALGRFFSSKSKPKAVEASLDVLRLVRRQVTIPIVAIGGITAQNGAPLIDAGADMLAVIDGVFGQADITRAASDIAALF